MAFGTATVLTTVGKRLTANRIQQTVPGTGSVTPFTLGSAGPLNCAMGIGATTATRTAVVGDVALSVEVETRTAGTETVSAGSNVYQVVGTITSTADRAVDEAGLFDNVSTTTSSGAIATATT